VVVKHAGYILITFLIFAALIGSVFVQPSPVSAATWYVDKAGTDDPAHGTGPGANAFLTINYAISRAGAGDTINIGLGTWVEQVIITKSLTLLGTAVAPTPNGTFIAAPADGSRTNYTAGDGTVFDYVIVAHDTTNVTVSTLTVYAAGTRKAGADYYATVVFDNVDNESGIIGFDSGCVSGAFNNNIADIDIVILDNSRTVVQNSLLVDFVRSGVECWGSFVRVHNSEINAEVPGATCVRLDHADPGRVDDNLLLSVGNGIVFVDCRNVIITGNELHGTAAFNGIQCQTAEQILIQYNTIYGFQAGIIDLGTTAVGFIAINEIFDCVDGIALNSATSVWMSVYYNLIHDNGRGLYHASQLNDVWSNIFYHNTTGIESANAITAHCNAILGNTGSGLNLAANGTFNVTNNYWGANSGPNVNGAGPGTGDRIATNGHNVLTYDPWAAMTLSATPNSIVADGAPTSTINLDCTHNSAGQVMGCNIRDGLQVQFTTTAGTLTSTTALTSAGHAVTSLRAGTVAGIATVGSSFSAAPGFTLSTTQVTFTTTPPPPPPQQLGINAGPGSHGSSLTATVTTQGPQNLPNVQVSAARLSAPSIATGSPVTVTADVTNTGTANGTAMVKVYLNDEPAATQGVNVARGSTVPMTFTIAPSQPGEYTVRVNNVQAGSLKVKDYNDSDIIFAAALAAFILLVTALLIVYLRRRSAALS
jgi:hypothetical protein